MSYQTRFVDAAYKEAIEETLKQTTAFSTKGILSKNCMETECKNQLTNSKKIFLRSG